MITYDIQDLGTIAGFQSGSAVHVPSGALDVNEDGVVVGVLRPTGSGLGRAFVWRRGQLTALHGLGGESAARSVNDDGVIAGVSNGHAVVWTSIDGPPRQIDDAVSFAHGINRRGQVVGGVFHPPYRRAVIWDMISGRRTELRNQAGAYDEALAINDASETQVVGTLQSVTEPSSGPDAFIWTASSSSAFELSPRAASAEARSINDQMDVVGVIDGRAAMWRHASVIARRIDLLPERSSNEANDVNGRGEVVGDATDGQGGHRKPFIYSRFLQTNVRATILGTVISQVESAEYELADLNDLLDPDSGWRLVSASAINDRGQIVGWGEHGGEPRAFLMSPRIRGTQRSLPRIAELTTILFGLLRDEGGIVIRPGGSRPTPVPPPSPVGAEPELSPEVRDAMMALTLSELARHLESEASSKAIRSVALESAMKELTRLNERLKGG